MRSTERLRRLLSVALALLILAPCAPAQRRSTTTTRRTPQRTTTPRRTTTPTPGATVARPQAVRSQPSGPEPRQARQEEKEDFEADRSFDEVIPSGGYAVYVELRSLGQLTRSKEMTELLSLARLVGGVKELTDSIDFYTANAEHLDGVDAYALAMPTRAGLPQFVGAYQFPSVESARSFEPKLRGLMKKYQNLFESTKPQAGDANQQPPQTGAGRARGRKPETAAESLVIKRYGRLIMTTAVPLKLKELLGEGEQTLAENARLQSVRSRFSSEPLLLFFDFKLIEKSTAIERELMAERQRELEKEEGIPTQTTATTSMTTPHVPSQEEIEFREMMIRQEAEASAAQAASTSNLVTGEIQQGGESTDASPVEVRGDGTGEGAAGAGEAEGPSDAEREAQASAQSGEFLMAMLFAQMTGGMPQWPEAVGAAITLDGDSVVARALVISPAGAQVQPIPFFPAFISGPAFTPQAASVAPADTEVFVSASLDFTQFYNRMLASMDESRRHSAEVFEKAGGTELAEATDAKGGGENSAEASIAAAEKLLGFKIREDLLPAVGNEVAVSVPLKWFDGGGREYNSGRKPKNAGDAGERDEGRAPVALVSLNNADAVKRMLPRVLEIAGVKSIASQGQTVTHAGVDINVYGGLAVAYVNNFLALSSDAASIRRLIDAGSSRGALASDELYRAATSWQPRHKLAEVYVSRALVERLLAEVTKWTDPKDAEVQRLLARLNIRPEAATYAVTGEGGGLVHELRVPTSIIKYFAAEYALEQKIMPVRQGDMGTLGVLTYIRSQQDIIKGSKEDATYAASFDELKRRGERGGEAEGHDYDPLSKQALEQLGYHVEMVAAGEKYTVTATPKEYGKTGRRSFFMDETGIIRAADRGGSPATADDPPVD